MSWNVGSGFYPVRVNVPKKGVGEATFLRPAALGRTETFVALESPARNLAFLLLALRFSRPRSRSRTECAPGWPAALPGVPCAAVRRGRQAAQRALPGMATPFRQYMDVLSKSPAPAHGLAGQDARQAPSGVPLSLVPFSRASERKELARRRRTKALALKALRFERGDIPKHRPRAGSYRCRGRRPFAQERQRARHQSDRARILRRRRDARLSESTQTP